MTHYRDSVYEWPFSAARDRLVRELLHTEPIDTGEWQSMDTSGSKLHMTHELLDVKLVLRVPRDQNLWAVSTRADLPWAENHFLERVSGHPLNPPPSHVDWPHAVRGNGDHTDEAGQFDHTYPERFWPKRAGIDMTNPLAANGSGNVGIRFQYGDLTDVVNLLIKSPNTRQAYLPVWFPEDTGGHARSTGPRVPCTLGYHFMIRDGILSCRYFIRSCDIRRHMHNDVYMAGRLMQWMRDMLEMGGVRTITGELTTYISSLHAFVADESYLRGMIDR